MPLFLFLSQYFYCIGAAQAQKNSVLKIKKLNTIRQPRSPGFIPDGTLVSSRVRQCACVRARSKIALVASVRASLHTGRNTRGFSLLLLLLPPSQPRSACLPEGRCHCCCIVRSTEGRSVPPAGAACRTPSRADARQRTHANARTHALARAPSLRKSRVVPVSPTQEARTRARILRGCH